jgi:hypothetical protein
VPRQLSPDVVRDVIRQRANARRIREIEQRQLWREDDDFHECIRVKLDGLLESNQFQNFSRCGDDSLERTCRCCGEIQRLKYRCNIKWCPRCQWRLTEKRKRVLQLWASRVTQPKHLVLTQKNFPVLTRKKIREHTRALARLRRAKAFARVKGGCVSVEITNENQGWHLHSHWLLDCRWLDMPSVSRAWAKLVGQEFAICKVMDVRERGYLQEVTKYVCDGSEMAKWDPNQLLEFVTAVRRQRFFFTFGTLFHQAAEVRRALMSERGTPEPCDCGSDTFTYRDALSSEVAAIMLEADQLDAEAKRRQRRSATLHDDSPCREVPLPLAHEGRDNISNASASYTHDERRFARPRRGLREKK